MKEVRKWVSHSREPLKQNGIRVVNRSKSHLVRCLISSDQKMWNGFRPWRFIGADEGIHGAG